MRAIRGLALGTYYAAGANAARKTPNASSMRGLVYAVKDNRDPPNPKQWIRHPLHPADHAVQVDRTNAIEYLTAMLGNADHEADEVLQGRRSGSDHAGSSIAALDKLLGASRPTAAFAVAVTDAHDHADAMKTRRFMVEYDETITHLDVSCVLD